MRFLVLAHSIKCMRRASHRLAMRFWAGPLLAAVAAACAQGTALAQDMGRPAAGIYTCVDDKGKRHTSDRPIAECMTKEQRILNADGSFRGIHPPSLTGEERAEREARERRLAEEKAAVADAGRRDRNLLKRYPDEASHRLARAAALENVRTSMRNSEARLRALAADRRPLQSEAEFYQGRQLPPKLKQQLDAIDAAVEAQRAANSTQEAELVRLTRTFDAELERLRRLWAGAPPGSLGPLLVTPSGPGSSSPSSAAETRRPPAN